MRLLFPALLVLVGCKEMTAAIVGGTVEAGKEVTSGIVEGVAEGRKQGASVDGAVVVTTLAELQAVGAVSVREVRAGSSGAEVVLAFDNSGDAPLRISGVEVLALDGEGFTQRPLDGAPSTLTVPPHAKDQLAIGFGVGPEKIATVRVWGLDIQAPPATQATATP